SAFADLPSVSRRLSFGYVIPFAAAARRVQPGRHSVLAHPPSRPPPPLAAPAGRRGEVEFRAGRPAPGPAPPRPRPGWPRVRGTPTRMSAPEGERKEGANHGVSR